MLASLATSLSALEMSLIRGIQNMAWVTMLDVCIQYTDPHYLRYMYIYTQLYLPGPLWKGSNLHFILHWTVSYY